MALVFELDFALLLELVEDGVDEEGVEAAWVSGGVRLSAALLKRAKWSAVSCDLKPSAEPWRSRWVMRR